MQFLMNMCVILSVNPSNKDGGLTNYLEIADEQGGQFSVSVKGYSTEELTKLRLRPISIVGELGGRRFGQNQVLSMNTFQIGEVGQFAPAAAPAKSK